MPITKSIARMRPVGGPRRSASLRYSRDSGHGFGIGPPFAKNKTTPTLRHRNPSECSLDHRGEEMAKQIASYMHRGGRDGRDRLAVLARVMAPNTNRLFDRLGDMAGWSVLDVGCGGGDVSFNLADRVGPGGRVLGLDLDADQLAIVRAEALERSRTNLDFRQADVLKPWPVVPAEMAYARFVFTHLPDPELALRHGFDALCQGGIMVIEDCDMTGHACNPPCPAFDRYYEWYIQLAKLRGGDPFIGRRLGELLERVGFTEIDVRVVQPCEHSGDLKLIPALTMAVMADGVIAAELATRRETDQTIADLQALALRADRRMCFPEVYQVYARRM
jgi:SAM-dependent methyltransferase